jgi:hypothetical protein
MDLGVGDQHGLAIFGFNGRSIGATIDDIAREVEPTALHCGNDQQALDV